MAGISAESIPSLVIETFSTVLEKIAGKIAGEQLIKWTIKIPNAGASALIELPITFKKENNRTGDPVWSVLFAENKLVATSASATAFKELLGQGVKAIVARVGPVVGLGMVADIGAITLSTVLWDQDGPEEGLRRLLSDPVKFGDDRLEDVKDIYYTTVIVGGGVVKDVRRQVFKKADVMAGVEADAGALAKEMGLSPVYDALLRNKLAGLKMGNEMAIQVVGAAAAKLHGDDVFVHEYDRRNGHVQAYMRGWPHRN